jgi:hypothetical protein
MLRWTIFLAAVLGLSSCAKEDKEPEIFLPRFYSKEGEDLTAARERACQPAEQHFDERLLTQQNFSSIFRCANYDKKLSELEPLFTSAELPRLIESANLLLRSSHTDGLKQTLDSWLKDGPEGNSRVDRLLPSLASVIKNQSFQDFLPVLSHILQAGENTWSALLPGLANVVHTDRFPDNLENAAAAFSSFSKEEGTSQAATIKDFSRFLRSEVDGKQVALHALELMHEIQTIEPPGTSIYEFLGHISRKGTIPLYFLNSGFVRGETVNPELNRTAEDPVEECPGLQDTPESHQQCAYERLFKRPAQGGDAPIVQLAALVAEMQKPHPEMLSSLARWYQSNAFRLEGAVHRYALKYAAAQARSQVSLGAYITEHAKSKGIDMQAKVNAEQLAAFLRDALGSPDFKAWAAEKIKTANSAHFGPRNAARLESSPLVPSYVSLLQAPSFSAIAAKILPPGSSQPLSKVISRAILLVRSAETTVDGKKKSVDGHAEDLWLDSVSSHLGEDVALKTAIVLSQNAASELLGKIGQNGETLAEWYFHSPYGNPDTTEAVLAFALTMGILDTYQQNKQWLTEEVANEAFPGNESDKRAFRMLVEQLPNLILYVRSGMARSGGDLTRALSPDRSRYLVRTYVALIARASETGWVRKGARLIEAFHQRPDRPARTETQASWELEDQGRYTLGAEALQRILWALITPEAKGDYSTSTLGRLVPTLAAAVSEPQRPATLRLVLSSAEQIAGLPDEQINDFLRKWSEEAPEGSLNERRQTYKSVADLMRNKNCPALARHLAGLFRENAVKPALDFLAAKIDDQTLPKFLLFVRRVLGYTKSQP